MMQHAQNTYSQNATNFRPPRQIEYDALAQITRDLKRYSDDPKSYSQLVQALHDNRKLWIILASDVADPANALPQLLRAQIFYLAEFTEQHTSKVIRREATAEPLIDINLSIMRGLNPMEDPS
jgi:flagellar protein FlaF